MAYYLLLISHGQNVTVDITTLTNCKRVVWGHPKTILIHYLLFI